MGGVVGGGGGGEGGQKTTRLAWRCWDGGFCGKECMVTVMLVRVTAPLKS